MPSRGAVLACALASTAGCYKATFINDPNAVRGAEREKWTSFFLFGLVGDETLDVNQFCPDGRIAEVQTGGNFLTGLVSVVTIAIYTPRRVIITCAGGRADRLELLGDREGRLVAAIRHTGDREVAAQVTPGAQPDSWHVSFVEVEP